ncbi:hypothetical protein I553_3008, partial [Mycobacterium xenopi 4042]
MSQLSFSRRSRCARGRDLTGCCGAGQIVIVGAGARLSVVVEQPWRAAALAAMIDDAAWCPRSPAPTKTPPGAHGRRPRLRAIAAEWTRGRSRPYP